jgi:hypothetical protein
VALRLTIVLLLALLAVVGGMKAAIVVDPSAALPEWLAGVDVADASGSGGVVRGWVRAVEDDRVVHLTRGLLRLDVAPVVVEADTQIRVGHKIGSIHDLQEGVDVRICYDGGEHGRVARIVEAPPSDTPCRVMATRPLDPGTGGEEPADAMVTPVAVPPATTTPADARATAAHLPHVRPLVKAANPSTAKSAVAPPAAARTLPAAPERRAATPPAAPVRRDSGDDGHDYGAVIDFVLRR